MHKHLSLFTIFIYLDENIPDLGEEVTIMETDPSVPNIVTSDDPLSSIGEGSLDACDISVDGHVTNAGSSSLPPYPLHYDPTEEFLCTRGKMGSLYHKPTEHGSVRTEQILIIELGATTSKLYCHQLMLFFYELLLI